MQPVPGAHIIALAFHVEFYGGATTNDPYVLPAATHRQQTYDSVRGRVYTPQGIVDGDREFLGSDDNTARAAIAAAARQPKINIDVSRSGRVASATSVALSVRYGATGRRGVTLTVVVAETNVVVLHHGGLIEYDREHLTPVVRGIQEMGAASPTGGAIEAVVAIPATAVRSNLTAVALLQDASNHHVLGVGTLPAGLL